MRYTRTALGLLNNQYRSILKKCLMINLGIFAYIGTANAETEITAEYLNSVTQFNDRVVWEDATAAGANTVQIGDEYYKYTYTQPSDYTAAPERLTDANITEEAVTNKVFDGFASTDGKGGAIYNSNDNSGIDITSDFLNNSATSSTSNHYGNAIYNVGTNSAHAKLGNISGVFINNSLMETSGGGTLSGMVIENAAADIGNITADFIANVNLGNGNSSGGVIFNSDATIGNISGSFIGNEFMSGSSHVLAGGVLRSSGAGASIQNISAEFIGNSIQKGATFDNMMGGLILNDEGSQIGKISGDFLYNVVDFDTENYVLGGLIYNADRIGYNSTIDEISGNFEHNIVRGNAPYAIYGGAISNYANRRSDNRINKISGDFLDNTISVSGYVMGFIYNDSEIGDITGDFKNNTQESDTVYGGILNYGGTINKIEGSTFENNTADGKDVAVGAAITNLGAITNGIVNAKFLDNKALSNTSANGAAIYNSANLKISADGSIGDGTSTFQGNYVQIANGEKDYQAIYVSGASRVLTLEAKNGGTINMYDYVTGSAGYTTHLTGDASGTVNLYNDIKNSNVSIEKVDVSTADGTLHDYSMLSLNSAAAVKWKIDVDTKNQTADTIATDANAATASAGTITLNELNYVDSSTADIVDGFKVQILKTQGSPEAANLQLALSDDLSDEFVISQTEEVVTDEVTADTKWSDVFNKTTTATTTSGQFALATTDTLNDSISATVTTETEKTVEKLGDTLALVNKAELNDKSFTADTADEVYTLEDDLGDTYGNLTINGVADGEQKSTVDLNGHDSFAIPENASLTLNDVVLKGDAPLSNAGYADFYNAEVEGEVDNSGTFTAENAELGTVTNENEATITGGSVNGIINSGVVNLTNTEFTSIDGNDGVVNMWSDVDLNGKKVSNNKFVLQGVKATATTDSFGENVDLVAESGSEVNVGNSIIKLRQATFGKDSQLTLNVDNLQTFGGIRADSFDIANGAKIDITFGQNPLDGKKYGEVALLGLNDGSDINNNNFNDVFHNNMYSFERKSEKSGIYGVYQTKTAEEISRENGGTKTNQGAAAAWVDGDSFAGGAAAVMADSLAELAQTDGVGFNKALTAIAPNDDGMVQAVTADLSDRLLLTVDNHLADSTQEQGLASGDKGKTRGYPDLSGVSTWAKGYYGKSKLQRRADIYGFDADSSGIIAGVDKKITSSIKAGLGMQYDDSDIDAYNRDVEAKTTLGFVYGEYRPSNWFVNGVFGYGVTDYDEDKSAAGQKVAAHYKTEIYSAQGLAGYSFKYFTPEIGARYYKIKRHGYVDGIGQEVSGENMDLLRTMAGVKAHADYGMFKPNAYFGMVYDVVSDRDNAIVNLSNGASYTVHGKRLPRFGVELGVGVTAQVTSKLELAIGYEAKFRKDYQDHSGTAVLKYSF